MLVYPVCFNKEDTPNTDPYFSNVVLLCHFDSTTGITDSSSYNTPILYTILPSISTVTAKVGNSSLYLDGITNYYLRITDSNNFWFDTNVFTIEFWYNAPAFNNVRIYSQQGSILARPHLIVIGAVSNATLLNVDIDTWTHIAYVGTSDKVCYCFKNGILTTQFNYSNIVNSSSIITIGSFGSSSEKYKGYLQELRITKNVARYTSNFIPPAYRLPDQ